MSSFSSKLNSWASTAWPPYAASIADAHIDRKMSNTNRWTDIQNEVTTMLKGRAASQPIDDYAQLVHRSEDDRRKTLESKGQTFLVGASIATSILFALPTFIDGTHILNTLYLFIVLIPFLLAIVHFLVAAVYSVKSRLTVGLALPNARAFPFEGDSVLNTLPGQLLTMARYNELLITKKANYVSVSETMFSRGLIFVAISTVIFFAIRSTHSPSSNSVGVVISVTTSNLDETQSLKTEITVPTKQTFK